MSHMKDFNAWGQSFIVELMQKYTPQSEEELFAIMVRVCKTISRFAPKAKSLIFALELVGFSLPTPQQQLGVGHHQPFPQLHSNSTGNPSTRFLENQGTRNGPHAPKSPRDPILYPRPRLVVVQACTYSFQQRLQVLLP